MEKPRLAFVSHVLPYPGSAGQQQRVRYILASLRKRFHVTFITTERMVAGTADLLHTHADDIVLLPSAGDPGGGGAGHRILNRARAVAFVLKTGLKVSNYSIGHVELTAQKLEDVLAGREFDLALYQYWHATASARAFASRRIPVLLDMHDILWRSRDAQLQQRRVPRVFREVLVRRYRVREERAWSQYDGLIAINRDEEEYARSVVGSTPVFYGPMGVDVSAWPYRWAPPASPVFAFYGGMGSRRGQVDALRCARSIMPEVWSRLPTAQLVLVGSNPPAEIQGLASDPRIRVLGYVEDVGAVLAGASVLLCPFTGTYGFRSRLIEVMATGTPIVASHDAVHGMELHESDGLLLRERDDALAEAAAQVAEDREWATALSRAGRDAAVSKFSSEVTYDRLAAELLRFSHSAGT